MEDKTLIAVTKENWKRLNDLKETPADTFDSVITRLLD